jgi:DNA-directed RNA polymerase subunit RPC12/RpoP
MPIRFRCQHCGQLMGIARRKAGTEVACPKCQQQVLVPPADGEEVGARAAPPVFERSEFEAYLRDVEVGPPAPRRIQPAPPMPLPSPKPPEPAASGEPSLVPLSPAMPGADYANGIVLSPTWATVLTVVIILLLALSFSVGLLVGRAL